jgi:ferritin-like protein
MNSKELAEKLMKRLSQELIYYETISSYDVRGSIYETLKIIIDSLKEIIEDSKDE